ncbi:unnamed protein product [Dibothriocephalus latus]|uniref:Uncharacterized protein n=1 Tax=Dibothriocephalus latus TaxID=60516 RepID=A0A3P7MKC9_DIBLA|nr:unnamed protein product [Dibothriocephalus latus]
MGADKAAPIKEAVLPKDIIMVLCTVHLLLALSMLVLLGRELFIAENPLKGAYPLTLENMETIGNIIDREVIQINPSMLIDLLSNDPLFESHEKDDQVLESVQNERVDIIFQKAVSSMLRRAVEGRSLPKSIAFLRRALTLLEQEARTQYKELAAKAEETLGMNAQEEVAADDDDDDYYYGDDDAVV